MSSVRFSVVIPAFNRRDTVGRAIKSALRQTPAPLEIVVVDDGSTDGTWDVLESFGTSVRGIRQENAGAAEARNRGVSDAKSEWVAFLDSDDYFLPGHLAALEEAILGTDGRASLYFANMRRSHVENSALLWDLCGFDVRSRFEFVEDGTDWAMLPRQPMMLQSSAVRRSTFLDMGGMMPSLRSRHDTHLFFKLSFHAPICAVNTVGCEMTADDQSGGRVTEALGTRTPVYHRETVTLYANLLGSYPELPQSHRRSLEDRLAAAHVWLARHHLLGRDPFVGARHLAAAARARPMRLAETVARRLSRRRI